MSFTAYKRTIDEGDTVIIYVGFGSSYALRVERGKEFQCKYGSLRHDYLIGSAFGSRVECTKGYVYALHPTPELWTQNLRHRTQILYTQDIGLITCGLELKPGSRVVEAGTGSGSLSHALARTIAPGGHLYTFDFHANRVEIGEREFVDHKLADLVTISARDVCVDGFGEVGSPVDAVFLDLPKPWEAVEHARAVLRGGGRFCAFSPCIEQVVQTCDALRRARFAFVETLDAQLRTYRTTRVAAPQKLRLKGAAPRAEKRQKCEGTEVEEVEKSEVERSASAFPHQQPTHTGYLTFATMPFSGPTAAE